MKELGLYLTRVQEEKIEQRRTEEIIAENFLKLTKDIKSQIQKTRTLASEQNFQSCEEKGFPTLFVTIAS